MKFEICGYFEKLSKKFQVRLKSDGNIWYFKWSPISVYDNTGWHAKCHTIDCTRNTFLFLQKPLTSGIELILIGWKIVPNESL